MNISESQSTCGFLQLHASGLSQCFKRVGSPMKIGSTIQHKRWGGTKERQVCIWCLHLITLAVKFTGC